jgi:hypothetical protein
MQVQILPGTILLVGVDGQSLNTSFLWGSLLTHRPRAARLQG